MGEHSIFVTTHIHKFKKNICICTFTLRSDLLLSVVDVYDKRCWWHRNATKILNLKSKLPMINYLILDTFSNYEKKTALHFLELDIFFFFVKSSVLQWMRMLGRVGRMWWEPSGYWLYLLLYNVHTRLEDCQYLVSLKGTELDIIQIRKREHFPRLKGFVGSDNSRREEF